MLECGNLGFGAVLRVLNLPSRSTQEDSAIAGRITLESANDVYQPVEIAQVENRGPFISVVECIERGGMNPRESLAPSCLAKRADLIRRYDSDRILDDGIPAPDGQPSFEDESMRHAFVQAQNQAMLGFIGIRGEKKCQAEQVRQLGVEQFLEVIGRRVFVRLGQGAIHD